MKKKLISIPIVILKTRTGYSAFSPMIEGCAATDKTIDKTLKRMKSALVFHLEGLTLLKRFKSGRTERILRKSIADYGTEAVYATVRVAA